LAKLRAKLQARLKKGSQVVGLEIGPEAHPLMQFAGMFKDDPLFDDWQKAIEEYRPAGLAARRRLYSGV
jgi:hypothetical protein